MTPNHRPLPPLPLLRELLFIDESSPSGLRWRINRGGKVMANNIAGAISATTRYWNVGIVNKKYQVHRIIYFMYHEIDPGNLVIDHIDRDKTNNKIDNLRLVDYPANSRNSTYPRKNSKTFTGWPGVRFLKGRYYADIRASLGSFDNLEDAIAARKAAEVKLWGQNYL